MQAFSKTPRRASEPSVAVWDRRWNSRSQPLHPESLRGVRLGWLNAVASRLDANEWRRRLCHMAPALLPLLLWAFPHIEPTPLWLRATFVLDAVVLVGGAMWAGRYLTREGECNMLAAAGGYAVPILALLLMFPSQPELGLSILSIVALGDGSATLFGKLVQGPALPWNPRKTWAGFIGFLVICVPYATMIYCDEAHPRVPLGVAISCLFTTALVADLIESLPSRTNDNLRVGTAAALTLVILQSWLVGWEH